MANIHLTSSHKVNITNETKISKSSVLSLAWFFVKSEGVNLSYAMKRAWKEVKGQLERNFWTDAPTEQVDYMIKTCSSENVAISKKIRNWDSVENQHPLDWVSYQLRRQGFKVSKVKSDTIIKREIAMLNIDSLKTPKGFNRIENSFQLSDNGVTYCMKNGFVCV